MSFGGFRLTKFLEKVIKALLSTEVSDKINIELDTERIERTLGIQWNVSKDAFTFSSQLKETVVTKRGMLKKPPSRFFQNNFFFTNLKAFILYDFYYYPFSHFFTKFGDVTNVVSVDIS